MATDGEGHDFISRLLAADDLPRLNGDELAKLRAFLAAPLRLSAIQADPTENHRRRKLKTILSYNDNLREQGDAPGMCSDARLLLDFVNEADALTAAIDMLHDQGDGPWDRTLSEPRELVIHSAGNLQKKVGGIRDALNRQGILTGERKDVLANLSRSLDYIGKVLRVSLANSWGYRITGEYVPPQVVKDWNGHWHTIRHTAINIKHWAEGMADADVQPLEPAVGPGPYSYGSDLHWLWAWAERINKWLIDGTLPNRHLPGIFCPDRLADQAVTRLSDGHPQAFRLIQADLADVQASFDGQDGSYDMQQALLADMSRLCDRIRTVAKMMANGEAEKTDAQLDAAKPVAKGGMPWQDAMKRAEEHVKAFDGAFPSVKRLAEIVGCSRPTMDKAIGKSHYLKARKAEGQSKQSGRTVPLSDAAIEEASERKLDELADLIAEQEADMTQEERQAQAAKKRRS